MNWTKLRDLTTPQAAEGRIAPSAGSFIGLTDAGQFAQDGNRVANLELAFDALTFGGTSAATSVTFAIWRKSDGRIDRVQTITIAATDAGSPAPVLVDLHGESLCVTVESFVGGTAPTIAGLVWGRPVRL